MTIKELSRELDIIKNNHLAHMAEDIDRLDKRLEKMDNRVWAILILLVGAVVLTFLKN
jgi:polyhydroxyalkanoate synthesis regulator phasin